MRIDWKEGEVKAESSFGGFCIAAALVLNECEKFRATKGIALPFGMGRDAC